MYKFHVQARNYLPEYMQWSHKTTKENIWLFNKNIKSTIAQREKPPAAADLHHRKSLLVMPSMDAHVFQVHRSSVCSVSLSSFKWYFS